MNIMKSMKPANCPQCLQQFLFKDFANKKKQPLLIGCGHSVCESCIRSAVSAKKDVVCKFCRFVKAFEPEMVQDLQSFFPIDQFTVGRLIKASSVNCESSVEFRKNLIRKTQNTVSKKQKCSECRAALEEVKCKQCEVSYCTTCFDTVHSAARSLRSHEKLPLPTDVSSRSLIEITSCSVHPDQKQDFYCSTCSLQVCSRCGIFDHGLHSVVLLSDQNKLKQESLDEALENASRIYKRLLFTKKKAHASLRSSDKTASTDDFSQLKNEISMHFQHLHGLLQIRENQLQDMVRNYENEQVTSLNKVIDELTLSLQDAEAVLSEAKQAMKPENFRLIDANNIINSLQEVCAKPCFLLLSEEGDAENNQNKNDDDKCDRIQFNVDDKVSEILKECGAVRSPPRKKYVLKSEEDLPSDYTADPVPDEIDHAPFCFDNESNDSVLSARVRSISLKSSVDKEGVRAYASSSDLSVASSSVRVLDEVDSVRFASNHRRPAQSDTESNSASYNNSIPIMMPKTCNTRNDLSPGSVEEVKVCHIINPSLFFVHRKRANHYLEQISRTISKVVQTKTTPKEVKEGWIYLVKYIADGKWYRAQVLKVVNDKQIRVNFIDFGNEDDCSLKSFRFSTDKITEIQPLANQCRLYNCHPNPGPEWSLEANKMMAAMCKNSSVIRMHVMHNRENCPLEVDLRCYFNGTSSLLRDTLVFHSFATYENGHNYKQLQSLIHQTHYNPSRRVHKPGTILESIVTHVEDPFNFYISNDLRFYEKLCMEMNDFYNNNTSQSDSKVYFPSLEMAVAVFDLQDRNWYRAKITKHPGNQTVELYYVDIGKTAIVNWERLRVLENKFLRSSYLATKCELYGVTPKIDGRGWPTKATDAFKTMVLKKLVRTHFTEERPTGSAVMLYQTVALVDTCINGLLIEQGLAASTSLISPFVLNKPRPALLPTPVPNKSTFEQIVQKPTFKPRKVRRYNQQGSFSPASSIAAASTEPERNAAPEDAEADEQQKLANKRFPCTVIKIFDPSKFYVMFDNDQWERIKKQITEFYSDEENRNKCKREEEWKDGDICAFRNSDSVWYRAIILSILPDNKAKLLVKDIVDEVTIATSELYNLKDEFKAILDISVRCHLCDLMAPCGRSGVWPSITIEEFQDHVSSRKVYFMQKGEVDVENKSVPAELWIQSAVYEPGPLEPAINEWYTVNQYLVDKGLALRITGASPDGFQSSLLKALMITKKKAPKEDKEYEGKCEKHHKEATKQDDKSESEESSLISMVNSAKKKKESSKSKEQYICPMIKDWLPALPLQLLKFNTAATYVDHDCNVYIQDSTSADILRIIETTLLSKYKDSKPMPHDSFWSAGQLCIVQYHADLKWYRGKVLEVVSNNTYKVVMVDYGNVETCKASDMRKNLLMTEIPIQCHSCAMNKLKPISDDGKWSVHILDYIHSTIVDRICEVELTGSVGNYSVVEIVVVPGMTLTNLLLSMQYATLVVNDVTNYSGSSSSSISSDEDDFIIEKEMPAETDTDEIKSDEQQTSTDNEQQNQLQIFEAIAPSADDEQKQPLSWIEMMEENRTKVFKTKFGDGTKQKFRPIELLPHIQELEIEASSILSATSIFAIVSETENMRMMKEEFITMQEEMQLIAKDLPLIKNPQDTQVCCSKFASDGNWYRGEIIKVNGDICTVKFVDYGNVDRISINEVHQLKPEWLEIPVQGLQMTLYNVRMASESEIADCVTALDCLFEQKVIAKIKSRSPLLVELYKENGKSINQELLTKPCFTKIE